MLTLSVFLGLSVLRSGDVAFQKRHLPDQARAALNLYREAVLAQPEVPEIQWRLAMAAQFVGTRLEVDPELVIPNGRLTIAEGAIRPFNRINADAWYTKKMQAVAEPLSRVAGKVVNG